MCVLAVRTPAGIALRLYNGDRLLHEVLLEPRRALLLGASLVALAAEGELTIEAAKRTLWGAERWGEKPDLGP